MKKVILDQPFEIILEQYKDMITRICILNLKNEQDAKDCFQNVFLKLFQYKKSFDDQEHLKRWLIRVTINECHRFRRYFLKSTISIDNIMIPYNDYQFQLLPYILELPSHYKNTLYLYYYEGYKIKEISQILNKNENTVKSYLKRGKELLKDKVGEFYE